MRWLAVATLVATLLGAVHPVAATNFCDTHAVYPVELATHDSRRHWDVNLATYSGMLATFGAMPPMPSLSILSISTASPADACKPLNHPVVGAVIVDQGVCSFATKAWHAQSAGATQVIIQAIGDEVFSPRCMETDPSFREFETSLDGAITVSMVVVSQKDGQALREAARRGELVTASIQTAMTSPAFWSFPTVTLICMALSTLLVSTKWALQDARAAHDLALRAQMADEEGEGEEEAEEGERQGGAAPKDPPADAAAAGHPFEPPKPMSQMMLSLLTAGTFVVTASSVLLLLYLFPTALTHVFDVIYFCGGVAGVHQVVEPAIVAFVEFAKEEGATICMAATPMDRSSFQYPFWRLLRLATSAILPFVWIACKDRPWIWLLHDVLSMLMMIFILRYIRLSNIKIATVMLMAALAYDVFWVLIQPRLTHSPSVMLMVATSADGTTPLPMMLKVPTWESVVNPVQFKPEMSILGYGDMLLPGLLLVYLRQFDKLAVGRRLWAGYHAWAITGYSLGLLASFVAMYMQMGGEDGQPALLYIVPLTLLPTLFLAWRRKEFLLMWRGQSWPIGSISHFMKLDQYDSDEEAFNEGARRQTVEMEMADVATIRVQVDDGTGEQGAGGGEIQVATPKLAPPPGGGAGTDGGVVSASTPATASSASTKRRPKPRGLASGFGPVRARAAAAAAPAAPPRVEAADASDSEFDI